MDDDDDERRLLSMGPIEREARFLSLHGVSTREELAMKKRVAIAALADVVVTIESRIVEQELAGRPAGVPGEIPHWTFRVIERLTRAANLLQRDIDAPRDLFPIRREVAAIEVTEVDIRDRVVQILTEHGDRAKAEADRGELGLRLPFGLEPTVEALCSVSLDIRWRIHRDPETALRLIRSALDHNRGGRGKVALENQDHRIALVIEFLGLPPTRTLKNMRPTNTKRRKNR